MAQALNTRRSELGLNSHCLSPYPFTLHHYADSYPEDRKSLCSANSIFLRDLPEKAAEESKYSMFRCQPCCASTHNLQ